MMACPPIQHLRPPSTFTPTPQYSQGTHQLATHSAHFPGRGAACLGSRASSDIPGRWQCSPRGCCTFGCPARPWGTHGTPAAPALVLGSGESAPQSVGRGPSWRPVWRRCPARWLGRLSASPSSPSCSQPGACESSAACSPDPHLPPTQTSSQLSADLQSIHGRIRQVHRTSQTKSLHELVCYFARAFFPIWSGIG